MTRGRCSNLLRPLLVLALLASALFAAATAAAPGADALPCTNNLHTTIFCVQPSPQPTCVSPYVSFYSNCAVENPYTPWETAEYFGWTCPDIPAVATGWSTPTHLGAYGVCYYQRSAATQFFSPTVAGLWG